MSFYVKNELVWAKIKGFPWWPGVIAKNWEKNENKKKEILVNFIGENSHASLNENKVIKFREKFEEYSVTKSKKLQEAIEIAQKILNKEVTYEEERRRVERLEKVQKQQKSDRVQEKKSEQKGAKRDKSSVNKTRGDDEKVSTSSRNDSSPAKSREKFFESPKSSRRGKTAATTGKEGVSWQESKDSDDEKSLSPKRREIVKNRANVSPAKGKSGKRDSKLVRKIKRKENQKKEENSEEEVPIRKPFRLIKGKRNNKPQEEDENSDTNKSVTPKKRKSSQESSEKNFEEQKYSSIIKPRKAKSRLLLDDNAEPNEYSGSDQMEKENTPKQMDILEENPNEKTDLSNDNLEEKDKSPSQINHTDLNEEENKEMIVENNGETTNQELNEETSVTKITENKRPNPIFTENPPSPKQISLPPNSDAKDIIRENEEGHEIIFKKIKQEEKPESETNLQEKTFAEENFTLETENSLMNKKLEKELEKITQGLSDKLKGNQKLQEQDPDLTSLVCVIEEFEGTNLSGFDLIQSNLGKIFKTLQHLLIQKKQYLNNAGELIILAVAKILHKIKGKIIQSCFDNTEYLRSFNIQIDEENTRGEPSTPFHINFTDIKVKMEEVPQEQSEKIKEKEIIRPKIEEENDNTSSQIAPVNITIEMPLLEQMNEPFNTFEMKQPVDQYETKQTMTHIEMKQQTMNHIEMKQTMDHFEVKQTTNHFEEVQKTIKKPKKVPEVHGVAVHNKEENTRYEVRRKICQKMAKLLQKSFSLDKNYSQQLVLAIENKLNERYMVNINEYKQAVKVFSHIVKQNKLSHQELEWLVRLNEDDFIQILNNKARGVENFVQQQQQQQHQQHQSHVVNNQNFIRGRQGIEYAPFYGGSRINEENSSTIDFNRYSNMMMMLERERILKAQEEKERNLRQIIMRTQTPNQPLAGAFQLKEEI